jgi:micrococcal nuclease
MSPGPTTLASALVAVLLPLAAPGETAGQAVRALTGAVVHVDDGDTIDVRIGVRVERVRYIGIDAPEVAHEPGGGRPGHAGAPGGHGAARLNAALVGGRVVGLELDVEARDRYGRLLAYVWVGDTLVNAELIRRGYARAMPIAPNLRYARRFAALESEARAERRGLWGMDAADPALRREGAPRGDRRPARGRGSEVLHVASRAGVGHVAHVRARLPERHGPRVGALGHHGDPARALRAQSPLRVRHQRARHAAAPPLR